MANIVITGTSRGIGFEMAKIYVAQGHQVLALSRNPSPIDALKLDEHLILNDGAAVGEQELLNDGDSGVLTTEDAVEVAE